ncbi:3'-5' exoribonuclease YhaM family protein [Desulfopila inferna]|uniref:3'-5' exoribonuclease YhaM family protein n=1 Tax=Desulfopila inferna TaxID=468528 RepID=UPI001963AB91|nr:HD domain-containing protein [Desulfopila inferna]MBM9605056.1 HD domain-containing protein [Desulfopila inferna]
MRKIKYIDSLQEGERIEDIFLVKSSRLAETRAGKAYLLLDLTDKSGEIGGPVWDNAEEIAEICRTGCFIRLKGQVQSYRDKLQLRIEDVAAVAKEDISLTDFVPATNLDLEEMSRQIQKTVASVDNSWVRKLLNRFFKKGDIWEKFQTAPAAKGIHHAYAGGLMEHCLSMAKVADMLAAHYPGVDRSILLAGVLLHDIGKIMELKEQVGLVDYTSPGRLKGHLVMGSEMVAQEAAKINDFPEELLLQIQHLILSHHGRLEFGSPAVPMTPEAFVLSFIDDLDSKMNLIEQLRRKRKDKGVQWTEYQRSLERFLFLGPLDEQEAGQEKNDAVQQHIQKTLF